MRAHQEDRADAIERELLEDMLTRRAEAADSKVRTSRIVSLVVWGAGCALITLASIMSLVQGVSLWSQPIGILIFSGFLLSALSIVIEESSKRKNKLASWDGLSVALIFVCLIISLSGLVPSIFTIIHEGLQKAMFLQ